MNNTIFPTQKIAINYIAKNNLSLPIDIDKIISDYAHVEYDDIPFNYDAIQIDSKKYGNKPLIIINNNLSYRRKRFTLAHELGHIIIPWHIGTISCHTNEYYHFNNDIYQDIETEANQFASELLIPDSFLKSILPLTNVTKDIQELSDYLLVSINSICIKLISKLPPGILIHINNLGGHSSLLKSPGTLFHHANSDFDDIKYYMNTLNAIENTINTDYQTITIWEIQDIEHNLTEIEIIHSSEILSTILNSLNIHSKSIINRINGIVGSANSACKSRDPNNLYSAMKQRFSCREDLEKIINHPDFELFIKNKVNEIINKQ